MFEGLIEKLILSYFGDYIENLDRKKLSVGIISGSLTLEDIVIKSKTINDMKLPFKLIYGRIGKLDIKIPWKSNFSAPTIINIETVQVVLSLIPQSEWEFLDFFSADYKLNLLKRFFENRIAELTEAFIQEEKSSGYMDRVLIKILDNLHINFKNMHIRIEDTTKRPNYSVGFTLQEMLVVNTSENWEEKFIDRNKQKDINVFKLLKLQNFGFYLKTDETYFISNGDQKKIREEMASMFDVKSRQGEGFEYLIKPISVVARMKQNNKSEDENNTSNITNNTNIVPSNSDALAKVQIWINLDNFDIDFHKKQFDTIIRILNHTSNYQKFQYFKYESRKFFYYRPTDAYMTNKRQWWRFAITSVIKRLKYLQGNAEEFAINTHLNIHYKQKFNELYRDYLKDPNSLTNEQWKLFKKILTLFDINFIYEWAIENIQEYFTKNKKEENKKSKKGFFGKMFGSAASSTDETPLTKEEEDKILEIIEYAKKEVKKEIIYSSKEVKLSIQFKLNEGSFQFSNYKKETSTSEAFIVKYKDLNFELKTAESFTEVEAYLMDFNIDMMTAYNKFNVKTNQITFQDKLNNNRSNNNYVWKLNFKQFGPEEKINTKLDLHLNTINMIYHQAFLERVLAFFIVETTINEDIVNKAWDKWSEIKEKTSEQIKLALEKKNILEINIEPRKLIIPLNKYDFKRSKILALEVGRVRMYNTDASPHYDDQYLLDFGSLSIAHFNSFVNMEENCFRTEIVTDLRLQLLMGILNKSSVNNNINISDNTSTGGIGIGNNNTSFTTDSISDSTSYKQNHQYPNFKIKLLIENININLTESIYYTFHFIFDVLKPTKQQDYWAIVEQSKQEIKKNCKAFGKIGKKNSLKQCYEELFAVLSGGYVYFYKNVEDDEFSSCFYIKDAVVTERVNVNPKDNTNIIASNENENENGITNEKMIYEINLKNKYGSIDLEFSNESKFKQWSKSLRERINEMKGSIDSSAKSETNVKDNNKVEVVDKSDKSDKSDKNDKNTQLTELTELTATDQQQNQSPPSSDIQLGLEINIKEVRAYLNNSNEKLFTINLSDFNFLVLMRDKDIEMRMSLYSIKVFDEKFSNHPHRDSLYEMLSSVDDERSDFKLFTLKIIISEPSSPRYNKAGIELDLKIGYVYAVWQPESIRRLLMFVAHNDILRNQIKEEIIGIGTKEVPINAGKSNVEKSNVEIGSENATTQDKTLHETRIPCTSTPNELWIYINVSLQKVSIIWVQPVLDHYFMEVNMNESNLSIEMTTDHFYIFGELGNTKLLDLTNYPYSIKSQDEYLHLKSLNTAFTEILGFKDSSSLSFEYKSFSIFCPLVNNNCTSSANVNFNSVKFTYVQEHFFRAFNYLFSEFLGALAPNQQIKDYRNILNKIPNKDFNSHMEFMNLHVVFNNPQVLLKARQKFDCGFLADLGTVVITNSYNKVKGKIRGDADLEKFVSVYHFDMRSLFLVALGVNNNFKLIEDTNAQVDMIFTNLSEEEKKMPEELVDKSFDINLLVGDVKLNLRQKDLTNFMKCNDLNFGYTDGLDKFYQYEDYKMNENTEVNTTELNNDNHDTDAVIDSNQEPPYQEKEFKIKESNYNSMTVKLDIPLISLRLFDNTTDHVFTELVLIDKYLYFAKKIYGTKEINILIKNSEVYNYVSIFNKEIMLSYFDGCNSFSDTNLNTQSYNNNLITTRGKNTSTPHQFDIKIVLDKDGEKNIIIKINNIKLTLRLDTLQLLRTFFTQGLPYYEENEVDIPNQYDFDEDNYPGMRVYVEIKNPLISLLSETMTNHDQDVICLSTDLVFLYKKEKIIRARRELFNNYVNLMREVKQKQGDRDIKERELLEKDIGLDLKEIYVMSVWLYDICPYVCNLNDILNINSSSLGNAFMIPRRKLMNDFYFHYENKTGLQYNHPNNYIQSFKSAMDINQITMKISYRDLVLFLKTMEYNVNLMDKDYEIKMMHLTNSKRVEKVLKTSERDMNPKESVRLTNPDNVGSSNMNNIITDNANLNEHASVIRKSKSSDAIMIDKGMGIISFESKGLQIILIDDHANTYYPFLSIILQDIKVNNENMSFTQSELTGSLLLKIVTYNYFAGIWEPLLEKTALKFDVVNEKSESSQTVQTVNLIVDQYNPKQYNPRQAMNFNISDITITFLYSTLSSWFEKYSKLKSNYREEVKKMIKLHSDRNMAITNHTVVNLTGRSLILHRANFYSAGNNEKSISYTKLSNVEPNALFDIEYLEDDKEFEQGNKNETHDISLNLVKENYICFEFSGIDQSKITENIIKIENEQLKIHKINYIDQVKKYKTNADLKSMEYIVSEIKYHDLRKFVYFYSPLVFKNKLQRKILLIIRRKDLAEVNVYLEPKKQMGVQFEYLDGSIEFCLKDTSGVVYDTKTFLSNNFSKSEMRFENNIINLLTNSSDNRKKKFVTINICASYVIRNCLPFDVDLNVIPSNTSKSNISYNIKKAERVYLEILSLSDNLICNMKCLNFENNKKMPVVLFNIKEYGEKLELRDKKGKEKGEKRDSITGSNNNSAGNSASNSAGNSSISSSAAYFTTSFILYDDMGSPLKLFATLVDSEDFRTIVIYSNGVLINNTLMDLKFYYYQKSRKYEVAGQSSLNRRVSTTSGNNNMNNLNNSNDQSFPTHSNVLLLSDENRIALEVLNLNSSKKVISESYPINAIGISTNVECKSPDSKIFFEFIMESHLSLVAQDLEIYTNIITIHPRFVIFNNLSIPLLICLKFTEGGITIAPELISPGQKKPFFFFGMSSDTPVCFRPIENFDNKYHSGSKWNWSHPINIVNTGLMTIQIPGINPIEKKYINMEKKILDYTTFVILNEATYYNSQFVIENFSKNISIKIFQQGYENSPEFVNRKSKCLYAWSDYNGNKNLIIEFMIGNLDTRPLVPQFCRDYFKKFKIEDDKIILDSNEEKMYPFREVYKISKNSYSGFLIKTEIFTDGMKKTIRISDYIKNLHDGKDKINTLLPTGAVNSRVVKEFNIRINKLGFSLISDNRNLKVRRKSAYSRYEIVYFILNEIHFYNRVEINSDESVITEMQLKIASAKIDNEYNYITQYPIILRPVNMTYIKDTTKDNASMTLTTPPDSPPFINFTMTSYKNNLNNQNETTKIILLNYLIQSFVLSIESEVVESVLNFISNITIQLNTSFTQLNPLFESYEENLRKNVCIIENSCTPTWMVKVRSSGNENETKFFIQTMETSSMEIVLSFNAQTKSKVFEKYVTSNALLSSILSTVSNLEKANILLNGSKMNNLYGSLFDIFQLVLSQYKQSILAQVFKIFGAIDVLGNPSNLVQNLGTGVQDFFQKPIMGIIKGPLEGVKGAIDGSVSLVRHTVDGTFNATSKITGGLSKGILYLTRDEKYINELEKKKITQRPKNFVEGIGYGITSMASGLYSGVSDVFVKPVEGAKKESVSGFGKGVLKGIGGLFAKPISGVLELVSKTSEGIKNTITHDDSNYKSERKPRAFYGKFKYIKSYNFFHADVISILRNKIEQFKQIQFDFYSAEIYKNHKNDTMLLVFTTYIMYIIDLERREIKAALNYGDVKNVVLETHEKIRINFKNEMNDKTSAVIFFSKESSTAPEIYEKIKEALDDNSDEISF